MSVHQPTLKEIARELSISISTVSRALQNHPSIGHRTRERVHALAEARNYLPNSVAIGLRTQRKNVVGVVVSAIGCAPVADWVGETTQSLFDRGYLSVVCQWAQSPDQAQLVVRALLSHRVDGVLLFGSDTNELCTATMMSELAGKDMPAIYISQATDQVPLRTTGHQAAQLLLSIIEG